MLLFTFLINSSDAAWPDASKGRRASIQILREDIGTGFPMLLGKERSQVYERVCEMKNPYYPICFYDEWVDEYGKTNIELLVKNFDNPTEPLAQVINAWSLGFIRGVPSNQAPDPDLAIERLSFACEEKSYAPGCSYLGDMYAAGVGVEQNGLKALELYDEACKAKDIYGCAQKGHLYLDGIGVDQDTDKAFAYFSQGCSHKSTQHCVEIGDMHAKAIGRIKDMTIAMKYYKESCDAKNGNACYKLAQVQRIVSEEKEQTFGLYSDLCLLGDLRACYGLGESYELGLGTPISLYEATLTYQESCDQNYAASCSKLGELHLEKMNQNSVSLGTELVQKGCFGGDIHGCFLYAEILKNEHGIEHAFGYYEQSCEEDYGAACLVLGQSFDNGEYVGQDKKKAVTYLEKGCRNANAESCRDLGKKYLKGDRGVKKDAGKALHFLSEGCKHKDKDSCLALAMELQTRIPSLDEQRSDLKNLINDYQTGLDKLGDTLHNIAD